MFQIAHTKPDHAFLPNHTQYATADCSKLASVENQQAVTTDHSSKKILLDSFVPNLTVQTFVSCLPISGGKFAAICCITFQMMRAVHHVDHFSSDCQGKGGHRCPVMFNAISLSHSLTPQSHSFLYNLTQITLNSSSCRKPKKFHSCDGVF